MPAPSTVRAARLAALALPLLAGCVLSRPASQVNTAGVLVDPAPNPIVTPGPTPKPNPKLIDVLGPQTPIGTKEGSGDVTFDGAGKVVFDGYQFEGGYDVWATNNTNSDVTAEVTAELDNMTYTTSTNQRVIPPGAQLRVSGARHQDPSRPSFIKYKQYAVIGDINAVHDDTAVYALPWRASGAIGVSAGPDKGGAKHVAVIALTAGTPVLAARDGRVTYVSTDGATLNLRHADGTIGQYAGVRAVGVNPKQAVKKGDVLAEAAGTLAFGVWKPTSVKPEANTSLPFMWAPAKGAAAASPTASATATSWEF